MCSAYSVFVQVAFQKRRKPTRVDRIPAYEIEQVVWSRIHSLLATPEEIAAACGNYHFSAIDPAQLIDAAQEFARKWRAAAAEQPAQLLKKSIKRIVVRGMELEIQLDLESVFSLLLDSGTAGSTMENVRPPLSGTPSLLLKCPFKPIRRGSELRLILPAAACHKRRANPSLLKAIARAHRWREKIVAGEIYAKEQLAAEAGLNASYLGRILRLIALAPELIESIVQEQAIAELSLAQLIRHLPLDWKRQKSELLCE